MLISIYFKKKKIKNNEIKFIIYIYYIIILFHYKNQNRSYFINWLKEYFIFIHIYIIYI